MTYLGRNYNIINFISLPSVSVIQDQSEIVREESRCKPLWILTDKQHIRFCKVAIPSQASSTIKDLRIRLYG
jgi:hypothetical protein